MKDDWVLSIDRLSNHLYELSRKLDNGNKLIFFRSGKEYFLYAVDIDGLVIDNIWDIISPRAQQSILNVYLLKLVGFDAGVLQ